MKTASKTAQQIKHMYNVIQARKGHAAIDFKDGELVLVCTKPTPELKTWGVGAVPQSYGDDWVRLVEC